MAPRDPKTRAAQEFTLRVAELLHAYGTPAHRLERVLANMCEDLNLRASFLVTPTSVVASFGKGTDEQTHLLRIEPGAVNLGKLVEFDQIMDEVSDGEIDAEAALERLEVVAAAPPRYGAFSTSLAFALASGSAALFFGGGGMEVAVSLALGVLLSLLERVLPRDPSSIGIFEPLAAFTAALLAQVAAHFVPLDWRIVTLSGLIVLVPGLTMTIALTELATRHLVSGVARLAGAASVFLTILLGVAIAWRIGDKIFPDLAGEVSRALPAWSYWIAISLAPLAFAIILEVRRSEFPVVFLTCVTGVLAARLGSHFLGGDVGPFLGALALGVVGNAYARLCDRPALVPQTPGILLLVPGSLGYMSLTSFLARDALAGMEGAFRTGLVAVALVGGLLAANVVLPPRRVL